MKHAPPPMVVKRLSSLTMVNPAAFIVLLVYICSALLLLPRGEKWGSHAHSLHQIWPSIAKQAGSWLPCRGWHTQHYTSAYHTFAFHFSATNLQETHPFQAHSLLCHRHAYDICYQDGRRRRRAPGPLHHRKSHPSQCFHQSTQPT